jgi:hypothetical protein
LTIEESSVEGPPVKGLVDDDFRIEGFIIEEFVFVVEGFAFAVGGLACVVKGFVFVVERFVFVVERFVFVVERFVFVVVRLVFIVERFVNERLIVEGSNARASRVERSSTVVCEA